MKKAKFKEMKIDELKKLLSEKQEELRAFRFNIAGAGDKNTKKQYNLRKDIARIMTEINIKDNQ